MSTSPCGKAATCRSIGSRARGALRRWCSVGPGASATGRSAADGRIAYALTTPGAPSELYVTTPAGASPGGGPAAGRRLTSLNDDLLAGRTLAEVEAFTFDSFDGTPIEAFLTRPPTRGAGAIHPMITVIHGGPHGQQGPGFDAQAQIYASQGWATLMVNYRGSTSYGQALADAIFKESEWR